MTRKPAFVTSTIISTILVAAPGQPPAAAPGANGHDLELRVAVSPLAATPSAPGEPVPTSAGAAASLAPVGHLPDFDADGHADLAAGVPGEAVGGLPGAGAVAVIYGSGGGLSPTGNQLWHLDRPGVLGAAAAGDAFGAALAWGDFNDDGFTDLAVGAPGKRGGGGAGAGAVTILYGSSRGLTADGNQLWNENSPGVEDAAEGGDAFGSALAAGDFDSDGIDDLAIGVPLEDVVGPAGDDLPDAGALHALRGSAAGLTADNPRYFTQDSPNIVDAAEPGDRFTQVLAVGDFNGDGFADLAAGVPGQDLAGTTPIIDAGAVHVIRGALGGGLTPLGDQVWHQNIIDVAGVAAAGDALGSSVATGDFDGDGFDDLAVGAPSDELGAPGAGAVNVLYGGTSGLQLEGNEIWMQGSRGIPGGPEAEDEFGATVAAGDLDGDGFVDLAVGAPGEGFTTGGATAESAGAVHVIRGSSRGLTGAGSQLWNQHVDGVGDFAETGDRFGSALTTADFDANRVADLAIGVASEDLLTLDEGAVQVLYGTAAAGLTPDGDQLWTQDSKDVLGLPEAGDAFGAALSADR